VRIAVTLFAAVLPFSMTAQTGAVNHTHHRYQVVQIPTLGGSQTNFFDNTNNIAVLNAQGAVSGGCAGTPLSDPNSSMFWWTPDGDDLPCILVAERRVRVAGEGDYFRVAIWELGDSCSTLRR
jgi:hypothetical protein